MLSRTAACYLLALIAFLLAAGNVGGKISWVPLGYAFLTASLLLP